MSCGFKFLISLTAYMLIFHRIFGPVRFLLLVCRLSWFLYTLNIYKCMHIFRHIFLSNYWWQRSDIWSQASYRYPISWEVFFDPSDSYFLFAKERGYHRLALAHSSSCLNRFDLALLISEIKGFKGSEKWPTY